MHLLVTIAISTNKGRYIGCVSQYKRSTVDTHSEHVTYGAVPHLYYNYTQFKCFDEREIL